MAHTRKPVVITNCVANRRTGPNERIIEFSATVGNGHLGGLIGFTHSDRPGYPLIVDVYRCDEGVGVMVSPEHLVVPHEATVTKQRDELLKAGKALEETAMLIARQCGTDHPQGIAELRDWCRQIRNHLAPAMRAAIAKVESAS